MAIDRISVKGARQHNLKNINVDIPRDRFTVITGLSGSGKFAESAADLQAVLAASGVEQGERSDARYVLGLCQVGLKQHAEAAASFQSLLKEDPKYAALDKV